MDNMIKREISIEQLFSLTQEKMDNMISENSRLKTKTLDLESEKDSLTKRLGEFESGLAAAEDAKQAVETELSQLKHKSQASVAELQRRVEAQAKVTNPRLIQPLSH